MTTTAPPPVAARRPLEEDVAHRPWPLPREPWVMFQSWRDLLFAHWPVPAAQLRPLIPPQLTLDEYDGAAWVGLTPFWLKDLHARWLPPLPGGLSEFPETNLRTYVRCGEVAGVWFFTLEASSRLAVLAARALYGLPYHQADMRIAPRAGWFQYTTRRRRGEAELALRYRPVGDVFHPVAGSLEHFLTERYALFSEVADRWLLRADVHHRRWPLQPAEAEIERNTIPAAHGLTLPDRGPLLHYAARQDTLVWRPRRAT